MRIAVITNDYEDGVQPSGGTGRIAMTYSRLFEQRGHEVKRWGPRQEFFLLSNMGFMGRIWFHIRDILPRPTTVSDILTWKPDVVLTHNLTGCGFGTPFQLRRVGIRWVHMLHDVQLIEPSGQIRVEESWRALRQCWRSVCAFARRRYMREPDVVISPTSWLLEFHRQHGWFERIPSIVIPNPLDPHAQNLVDSPRDRAQLLFVGRLDSDKGIETLLQIWPQIRSHVSRWVIIGEGIWASRIAEMKDDRIVLRGRCSSGQVFQAMQESGVLVVPSRILENQPTVILEGLAAGCQIIASDVGGIAETLGGAGRVVSANSLSAWRESIVRLMTTDLMADDETRHTALAHHDPEGCASAVIGCLRSNLKT